MVSRISHWFSILKREGLQNRNQWSRCKDLEKPGCLKRNGTEKLTIDEEVMLDQIKG